MFFVALATDYDGTLALHGKVDAPTRQALVDIRSSGRKLIMVTGRDLPDLKRVFPELDLFDMIVAENGALLYDPATQQEIEVADPPPAALVARLRERNVHPLTVGRSIIATWEPNETIVLEAIRDLNLEQHIVFNKGAVMVLPSGVNKASGLKHALARMGLSPYNVVGIGDAENDLAFLSACGCAVAVDNALDTVKAKADVRVADHGAGVVELARMMIDHDLEATRPAVPRGQPSVGATPDGAEILLSPFETVLVTGNSGGGKSTIVTAVIEQLRDKHFQFCIVDPEGDYSELSGAVTLGDHKQTPDVDGVLEILAKPDANVVVNLLAIDPHERPYFLAELLPKLFKLRRQTGRPHWIVLDEAHHCLPAKWEPAPLALPREMPATIAVTVHPEEMASEFLALVSTIVGVGNGADKIIADFCTATGRDAPATVAPTEKGQLLVLRNGGPILSVQARTPKDKQKRHIRKYADGTLGDDKSFFFRGPEQALNLKAQNLTMFVQLAMGVDDGTWMHHLHKGEYSQWFESAIKDKGLAAAAAEIEADTHLSPEESRAKFKEMIDQRYTAPAKKDA